MLLLLVLSTDFACKTTSKDEYISWMTEVSNIKIPDNYKLLQFYNNYELGIIIKFSIDPKETQSFIKKNNLSQIEGMTFKMLLIIDIENNWYVKNGNPQQNNSYFFLEDCNEENTWRILINVDTNEVWFEMMYSKVGLVVPDCNDTLITNN